ncbi:hypothetical protein SDC9_152648 [bioreactor metagenome]|uniref:Uncharacterized protein n=1 Tax=bioreactor metagenome TaxID=1076179 RepID=A0A645ETM2_9ZZZZ
MQDAPFDLQRGAQGSCFHHPDALGGLTEGDALAVGAVNVPGVPIYRAVFKGLPFVRHGASRQNFTGIGFIQDTHNIPGFVQFHAQKVVF